MVACATADRQPLSYARSYDAGAAAFLAGIDYSDPVLDQPGRQGWIVAEQWLQQGREDGEIALPVAAQRPPRTPILRNAYQAGYQEAAEARAMNVETGSPWHSQSLADEFVGKFA